MSDPIEAALKAVRRRIASPAWADDLSLPAPIGTELDGLADEIHPHSWSPERQATLAALRTIRPRQKIAVLSMASNEAPYLPEWIAHYRAIGADHLFIYTNANHDGTDDLLRWYARHAPVTPIFTTATPGINIQAKNYEHALFLLPELRLFEWIIMADADEFLIPGPQYHHHLPTLLAAAPADTDTLLFPWRWRLWDRAFERQPGLLAERYPHAGRSHLDKFVTRLRHVNSLRDVHAPRLDPGGIFRDTEFALVPPEKIWSDTAKTDTGGWMDHYWGKSFEEFLIKKRRGEALALETLFQRAYDDYFTWTGPATPANHSPTPEPILTGIQREMARMAAKPGYRELMEKIETTYTTYAQSVRNDPTLRELHADYLRRTP